MQCIEAIAAGCRRLMYVDFSLCKLSQYASPCLSQNYHKRPLSVLQKAPLRFTKGPSLYHKRPLFVSLKGALCTVQGIEAIAAGCRRLMYVDISF